MSLLCAIFEAIWRRCFGCSGWDIKIISNRFVEHIIGFLGLFLILLTKYNVFQSLIVACVMQGLYWARTHGAFFDFGHSKPDIKRYDDVWYWKYVKKYIPENMLYGYDCDYLLMNIRYTIPSIIVGLILMSVPALFMGFALTGMYALCWLGYDFGWTKRPTEIAEYLGGFITGLLLML